LINAETQSDGAVPIIALKDVTYEYPNGVQALSSLSMQIEKGQKAAILGANGAGKSTMFLHLNGILKPSSGQIFLNGQSLKYTKAELIKLRKTVGIVFQDPDDQLFSMNVFQDISFGPMNLGYEKKVVKEKVEQAMELVKIQDLRGRPTHQLSYGQKKRVAIAGVLAMEPSVIILDEPTASLDPSITDEMMELFEDLYKAGKTLIMSTHEMDLAYKWADYCFVLKQGKIAAQGLPQDIFSDANMLEGNNLRQPWLIKVYAELLANGLINKDLPLPCSEEELFLYFRSTAGQI